MYDHRGPRQDHSRGMEWRGERGGRNPQDRSRSREPMIEPKRPFSLTVQSNMFAIKPSNATISQKVYMYDVQIQRAKRIVEKDEATGRFKLDSDGKIISSVENAGSAGFFSEGATTTTSSEEPRMRNRAGPLSRRILMKLKIMLENEEPPKLIFTDGTAKVYTPHPLATDLEHGQQNYSSGPTTQSSTPSIFYDVCVKRDCEEDFEDKDLVQNAWFKVQLTFAGDFDFTVADGASSWTTTSKLEEVAQCLNVAIRNSLLAASMMPFRSSPRMFYFRADANQDLIRRVLKNFNKEKTITPVLGVVQAARMTGAGELFLIADFGLGWAQREMLDGVNGQKVRVRVLDEKASTIAGIRVPSFRKRIPDNLRSTIESSLKKMSFHIEFECGDKWAERKRAEGMDDEKIRRGRKKVRGTRFLWTRRHDRVDEAPIVWNPAQYTFEISGRDGAGYTTTHTVLSYFDQVYDVQLKYPEMPLVQTRGKEYFPIEMLFQGVGEAHGCNSDFKKEKALAFNDEFSASRRVSKLKDILSEPNLEKSQNQALASFQLKLHREPLQMQATVLEPPVLSFGSAERAVVKNGSWNLWNQQRRKTSEFNVPVQLLSFAVLDMSKDEISGKIIEDLLRVLQKHGVQIPDIGADSLKSMIANVTVRCFAANKQQIWAAFENSIARARQHFFTESNVSFAYSRTIAFFKEHGLQECLVVPHVTAHSSNLFVIPPAKVARWCYEVQCPADTTLFAPARRMYKCKVRNLREMVTLDPFDLKLENGIFKGLVEKAWLELEVVEPIYHVLIRERTSTELFDEIFALGEDQVVNPVPCYSLASKDVECPSLMFAVIPTKDVSTYAFVKYLSHVEFGIPSQVMVEESYQNQRSKTEAYCAGIALKLNTKLSNSLNRSTAWSIYSGTARQWLMDTPTMIMGYCVASGPGQDSKSIVVGTASLDVGGTHCCHDKRVQSKSHIVDSDVLEEITESLAMQFFLYNNVSPQRILVYRSGVQDGLLQDVVEYEIGAIRQAFYRLNMSDPAWSCENCKGNTLRGCVLCCPSVTFVVSQGQHDIRIVPLDGVQMNRSNNVPSGTCVTDSRAISMSSLNAVEMNSQSGMSQPESTVENTMDFLLVPQGGLKGTSRPVYYRCLLNETKLTRSLLKNLTYQFSFQYGTATKSVRNVPVLQYGVRLANTILSYLGNVPMDESKHVLHETFLPSRDENGVPDRNWVPFRPHISA